MAPTLLELKTSNLVQGFVWGIPIAGAQIQFLAYVRSNVSLKLLELVTYLVRGFNSYGKCRAGAQMIFPESGRGVASC